MARAFAALGLVAGLVAAAPLAQAADGAAVFETRCSACHAAGGVGTPGLAPPLNRPGFWSGLGDKAPEYIAGVVTHGLNGTITAAGQKYLGLAMPPVAIATDEELAQATSWVLATLGGLKLAVTADDIAAARAKTLTAADLRAMRPASE